jgi:hypothetical protein
MLLDSERGAWFMLAAGVLWVLTFLADKLVGG